MISLFRRRIDINAGGTLITNLEATFDVTRTLDREPNTASVNIYNLKESTRGKVEGLRTKQDRIEILAGYQQEASRIFRGDVRRVVTYREGPDIITSIEAGDGERLQRVNKFARSYAANTSLRALLEDLAAATGLEQGNLEEALGGNLEGNAAKFENGIALSGNASDLLAELLASNGFELSVQDGRIQVLGIRRGLSGTALVLSQDTGLIGVPSVDDKGILSCETLMIPDLFPGRKIIVESQFVSGSYRVQVAKYRGSLYSNQFGIAIEGRAL